MPDVYPDLTVVSSGSTQGQAPNLTNEGAALAEDTPTVMAPAPGGRVLSPVLQQLLLGAAFAGGTGAVIGGSTAPKNRRGAGTLIGFLAGIGFHSLRQGVLPLQNGTTRAATLATALAALGTAGWLAYRPKR